MEQYDEFKEWVAQEETRENTIEEISNTYIAETQKKIDFWNSLLPIVIIVAIAWRIHRVKISFRR